MTASWSVTAYGPGRVLVAVVGRLARAEAEAVARSWADRRDVERVAVEPEPATVPASGRIAR